MVLAPAQPAAANHLRASTAAKFALPYGDDAEVYRPLAQELIRFSPWLVEVADAGDVVPTRALERVRAQHVVEPVIGDVERWRRDAGVTELA